MTSRHSSVETTLGRLTITADDEAITGVYFPHHWYPPTAEQLGREVALADDALLSAAGTQIRDYLAGERDDLDLPTATHGDPFQESVWEVIGRIPRGETISYGEIARRLGDPSQAQRVGQAVGRNPLSIVVPCHRVVGADGKLTGYAGGIARKQQLLQLELPVPADALF